MFTTKELTEMSMINMEINFDKNISVEHHELMHKRSWLASMLLDVKKELASPAREVKVEYGVRV